MSLVSLGFGDLDGSQGLNAQENLLQKFVVQGVNHLFTLSAGNNQTTLPQDRQLLGCYRLAYPQFEINLGDGQEFVLLQEPNDPQPQRMVQGMAELIGCIEINLLELLIHGESEWVRNYISFRKLATLQRRGVKILVIIHPEICRGNRLSQSQATQSQARP